MYCNEVCRESDETHHYLCNNFLANVGYEHRFVIDSILLALEAHDNDVNSLMRHVEEMIKKPGKLPPDLLTKKNKYEFFFKLAACKPNWYENKSVTVLQTTYTILIMLTKVPKIGMNFTQESRRTFLVHLIIHHIDVLETNSFGTKHGSTLGLFESLFNHSCKPNLGHDKCTSYMFYYANQNIKAGTKLEISYISVGLDANLRRMKLKLSWGQLTLIY